MKVSFAGLANINIVIMIKVLASSCNVVRRLLTCIIRNPTAPNIPDVTQD